MLGNLLKKFPLYSTSGYSWSSNIYKLCQRGWGGWVGVVYMRLLELPVSHSQSYWISQTRTVVNTDGDLGPLEPFSHVPSLPRSQKWLYLKTRQDYACSYFIFITQIPYSCSSVFLFRSHAPAYLSESQLTCSFPSLSHVLFLILFCFHSRLFVWSASLSFWHILPSCFQYLHILFCLPCIFLFWYVISFNLLFYLFIFLSS